MAAVDHDVLDAFTQQSQPPGVDADREELLQRGYERNLKEAEARLREAIVLLDGGRFTDALPRARAALVLRRPASGESHVNVAHAHFLFTRIHYGLERFAKARDGGYLVERHEISCLPFPTALTRAAGPAGPDGVRALVAGALRTAQRKALADARSRAFGHSDFLRGRLSPSLPRCTERTDGDNGPRK